MPGDPITVELLNPPRRVCVGEEVPLHLVIRCPPGAAPAVLRTIASRDPATAGLLADLFERDVAIRPGEVYRCTVIAVFRRSGRFPDPLFVVRVGLDAETRSVRVPTPAIHVVPSLLRELRVGIESICTYECGTKVDVTVTHVGATGFEDLRIVLGPAEAIRAGVSDRIRPAFAFGERLEFTAVVGGDALELVFEASSEGERVGPVSVVAAIPPVRDMATALPYRFLEPKKLTQAEVKISTLDESGQAVRPTSGVHDVYGAGTKYRVEIRPAHPHVSGIRLRGVSGSVEVTDMPSDAGAWAFQMVVVTNRMLTSPEVLHYDVATPEGPQQGELNLAVRPSGTRLWIVAVTAGAAVTVKGLAAVVPALLNPGDLWSSLSLALTRVDTVWDLLPFLSIPLIRAGLWAVDRAARVIQFA